MPTLDAILESARSRLPRLRSQRAALEQAAEASPAVADFATALSGSSVALIAEVKRRSPSVGLISRDLDPAALASAYAGGGAAAISVLTDAQFFGGSLDDLRVVATAVALPVLRKDFILDETQLLEARVAGAAAALLIVRVLDQAALERLIRFASSTGLAALVEAHDAAELQRAVDAGAQIIGINARDLDTLAIDATAAWRLIPTVPRHCLAVAESGMTTVADVRAAAASGADAVLVGSALVGAPDPGERARAMAGVARRAR